MRLSLFRQNIFEGLVIAMSDAAEEAAKRRSLNMIAWKKLGKRNSTEPAKGSDTGPDGSSSDLSASVPADTGPEDWSTSSVETDPEPTISAPASTADSVSTEVPSSAPANNLPLVATAPTSVEIPGLSTTPLPAVIETPNASPQSSTTDLPPPVTTTSAPVLTEFTPVPTTEVGFTMDSAPAAAATSSSTSESTSISNTIASSTEVAPPVAATSTSVLADTSISSSTKDSLAPVTTQASTTESLPPVVAQTSALDATTTSSEIALSSEINTSAGAPPATSITSLPPIIAPFTENHLSTPPLSTTIPPGAGGVATAKSTDAATIPPTQSSTADEDPNAASSTNSNSGTSFLQNRPSSFVTSITPTQVADSLPSSQLTGVPGNSGSGSGLGNVGGTGGNDVSSSNGGAITQTSADHASADSTTTAVGVTFVILGSLALLGGIVYLIRSVLRQRRLGKAYSPPSSPLLNATSDTLPSGIERSMSERLVMGTRRSQFWNNSDSSTTVGPVGGHRKELSGGGYGMATRTEVSGGSFGKGLDIGEGWNENLVIPPLSPLPPVASPGVRIEKVDGMGFEMIGDTAFGINEKPLGRHGPLGENPRNF